MDSMEFISSVVYVYMRKPLLMYLRGFAYIGSVLCVYSHGTNSVDYMLWSTRDNNYILHFERALSALRTRTLRPASAHSQGRECALIFAPYGTFAAIHAF